MSILTRLALSSPPILAAGPVVARYDQMVRIHQRSVPGVRQRLRRKDALEHTRGHQHGQHVPATLPVSYDPLQATRRLPK